MSMRTDTGAPAVRSLIPARLDRLPWTRFHTRLIMALGVAWVLDGLEITLAGAVAGVLTNADTLHMSSAAVGAVATVYLVGEVAGALFFGKLSDKQIVVTGRETTARSGERSDHPERAVVLRPQPVQLGGLGRARGQKAVCRACGDRDLRGGVLAAVRTRSRGRRRARDLS